MPDAYVMLRAVRAVAKARDVGRAPVKTCTAQARQVEMRIDVLQHHLHLNHQPLQ
jgi:hypothetical protein